MNSGERVGKWELIRRLGKGGQGEVFLVRDVSTVEATNHALTRELVDQLHEALSRNIQDSPVGARAVIGMIRSIAAEESHPTVGALKKLLPIEDAVNSSTAHARMKAELKALKAVSHPALTRVLDEDIDRGWFVMDYLGDKTLTARMGDFEGDVLGSLLAIRPVVDAVSKLHQASIVHRDIKPDNIFAPDRALILGDCGLAIRMDAEERLTMTYENAGSRDWMPGWAMGMRIEDVTPAFDVFALGKVLWAMVSKKPKLRLWYYERPEFNLAKMFPDDPRIPWITRILSRSIREHEEDCFPNASLMLEEVDLAISAISTGAQLPSVSRLMRCRFCGMGQYRKTSALGGYSGTFALNCPECGHLETFTWPNSEEPPAWKH